MESLHCDLAEYLISNQMWRDITIGIKITVRFEVQDLNDRFMQSQSPIVKYCCVIDSLKAQAQINAIEPGHIYSICINVHHQTLSALPPPPITNHYKREAYVCVLHDCTYTSLHSVVRSSSRRETTRPSSMTKVPQTRWRVKWQIEPDGSGAYWGKHAEAYWSLRALSLLHTRSILSCCRGGMRVHVVHGAFL